MQKSIQLAAVLAAFVLGPVEEVGIPEHRQIAPVYSNSPAQIGEPFVLHLAPDILEVRLSVGV